MSDDARRQTLRIGMLGCGTVGQGVYRMLGDNREAITQRMYSRPEIVAICVRNLETPRGVAKSLLTDDLDKIVDDPTIDVIIELIGGTDPAADLVERALRAGKSVVTANKELIAKSGHKLVGLAKQLGLDLHFEAAVGGGIPLIQPLKHQLAGNDVLKLMGILNGTTNYILSRMASDGAEFADVLKEAQAQGFAEADPTSDVDGYDASYKLAILGSIAVGKHVPIEGVYREGIRGVSRRDIEVADLLGYKIKLLGIVQPDPLGHVMARVHPTLIPKSHPLASVDGVYNAVWIHGDFVGDLMFSGRGAGGDPTASAVVGDLIDVGRNLHSGGSGSAIPYEGEAIVASIEDVESVYYLRVVVRDRPKVLGHIALAMGDHDISLAATEMRVLDAEATRGEIVFITHSTQERRFRAALKQISEGDLVESIESWIRVEE